MSVVEIVIFPVTFLNAGTRMINLAFSYHAKCVFNQQIERLLLFIITSLLKGYFFCLCFKTSPRENEPAGVQMVLTKTRKATRKTSAVNYMLIPLDKS